MQWLKMLLESVPFKKKKEFFIFRDSELKSLQQNCCYRNFLKDLTHFVIKLVFTEVFKNDVYMCMYTLNYKKNTYF